MKGELSNTKLENIGPNEETRCLYLLYSRAKYATWTFIYWSTPCPHSLILVIGSSSKTVSAASMLSCVAQYRSASAFRKCWSAGVGLAGRASMSSGCDAFCIIGKEAGCARERRWEEESGFFFFFAANAFAG
jgi:hypothetical protein